MNILYIKACEYAVQQANGRQTLIGIFDNIVAPHLPIEHPPFFLCIQLEFEPHEAGQTFATQAVMIDDDGRKLFDFPLNIEAPRETGAGVTRVFMSIHVPTIRLERTGEHRFDLIINGQIKAQERIPLLIAATAGQAG